jgi:hypothetical protein
VTTYQTRTYYEPVTTYQTSYYYEPVTTVRYSCYFDPCSCSYQQVACPSTCYQLRSQCTPVQSWVQRCCSVPVTSYRQSFYFEPVTTCTPAPAPCCPTSTAAALPPADCNQAPATGYPQQAPAVGEQRSTAPPAGVREYPNSGTSAPLPNQRYYPPTQDRMEKVQSQYRQGPSPYQPPSPPAVRLDRIVAIPDSEKPSTVLVKR